MKAHKCEAKWCRKPAAYAVEHQVPDWRHIGWITIIEHLCSSCFHKHYKQA